MNTVRLTQARRLFCSEFVSREVNRRNQRRWVASVKALGPKWVGLLQLSKVN